MSDVIRTSRDGECVKVDVGDDGRVPSDPRDPKSKRVLLTTTIGRAIFNDILPPGMPFYNYELDKKSIQALISDCHRLLGRDATLRLLDDLKDLGFKDVKIYDSSWIGYGNLPDAPIEGRTFFNIGALKDKVETILTRLDALTNELASAKAAK